jgi:hypothetical protein
MKVNTMAPITRPKPTIHITSPSVIVTGYVPPNER